jgi:hypothetical protein
MKSDISRNTFDSRKHYSQVVMQQGRVQLDADWNEQQDILLHHIETQTGDMIGPGGVSADTNGFAVTYTPDHSDLIISPGYIYVDGILCELEAERAIPVQSVVKGRIKVNLADVDNPPLNQDELGKLRNADEQVSCPFKKDHWVELIDKNGQRLFDKNGRPSGFIKATNVEVDREKQVVFLSTGWSNLNQGRDVFKVRPIMTYLTQPNYPKPIPHIADLLTPENTNNKYLVFLAYLDVQQRQITALDDPGIREVALGGADTTQRIQTFWKVKLMPIEIDRHTITEAGELVDKIKEDTGNLSQNKRKELERLLRILTFVPPISRWIVPNPSYTEKPNPGRLSVRLASTNDSDAGIYHGLENQLYRVEIDQEVSKDNPTPTFKWARNNASSLVEANVNKGAVTIPGGGQGSLLGLKVGQYVELLDEQSELLDVPGHLAKISQVNDITGQLTLDPTPPENLQVSKLRLWDGTGNIDGSKGTNTTKDGWIILENGIEIQFTSDTEANAYSYKSGDYWLIAARTATGNIDWPHTAPQPPHGIEHHFARLACLLQTKSLPLVQDCRKHFFPLTTDALHILDINWTNDIEEKHDLLYATRKLRIILDGEPDQQCARAMQAAMIVSVETALPGGAAGIFLISGIFNIDGNVITWHWHEEEESGLIAKFFERFDDFYSDWFRDPLHRHEPRHHVRVRVTLKGHLIWQTDANGRRIYLDGQTFGIPGLEKSGHRPKPAERGKSEEERGQHIYLQFPSGTGRPASDFESWFYIRE